MIWLVQELLGNVISELHAHLEQESEGNILKMSAQQWKINNSWGLVTQYMCLCCRFASQDNKQTSPWWRCSECPQILQIEILWVLVNRFLTTWWWMEPPSPVKQLYGGKLQHHFPHSSAVKTEISINMIESFLNKRILFVLITSRLWIFVGLSLDLIWTVEV